MADCVCAICMCIGYDKATVIDPLNMFFSVLSFIKEKVIGL